MNTTLSLRSLKPTPLMIEAAGFPLPDLYRRALAWTLAPWEFLRGERFLTLHHDLNSGLARGAPGLPRVVVPFAACEETGAVACIQAIPEAPDVLLIHPGEEPEVLAALPSFGAWLRMAVDDVVRAVEGAPTAPPKESPPASAGDRPPLPFERDEEGEADPRSSTRRHLLRVLRESEVDLEFVAAEAGDQPLTSASLRRNHERIKAERGERLYADMLVVLTQHRYPDRMAKWLWGRILQHQRDMTRRLARRVEITVASLDFLNQNEHLVDGSLVLCSEDEMAQVADVALRDGLTGLFDQATFRVRLTREVERVRRYQAPLSLLMLDLDRFKRLNDERGHLEGDRVLAALGELLHDELRAVDVAARYGGEEFAVLLPETRLNEAARLAERLRVAVEERFAGDLDVTVSVGVAAYPEHGREAEALIEAADRALYRSKETGRNRTTCATPLPAAEAGARS